MSLSIWEGNKAQNVIDSLDNIALMLAGLNDREGDGLYFKNFKTIQQLNRMGLAYKVLSSYDYIVVNKETSLTITKHGDNISAASIDPQTFIAAIGEALTKEYEFIYDGSAWKMGEETVLLSAYGITITGTPAKDDTLIVDETAEAIRYDIIGIDHDIPSDPNFTHTITLCRHDCANYNVLAYCKPQGLIYVDPEVFPNGIASGTSCYVTLLYGAYDNSTTQDGSYQFTTPVDIPAGGLIRHTSIGAWQSGSYTVDQILNGKFEIYDTIANGRARLANDIATSQGSSGTYLGTASAEDPTKCSASYVNMTRRNAYGSNNYLDSQERKWMNSNAKAGLDAHNVPLWQNGEFGIFDLPASYNAPGNLFGMDPELLDVIGPVRKRTYLHPVDRSDQSVKHVDTDELIFPLSMNEVGLGTTNDGVYENAVDHNGTVKTEAYDYYKRRTTNPERIKYFNGTARYWFFRSPYPSSCHHVRTCVSSGALDANYAYSTYGAVDAYNII